jgi:hypothetical protein
MSADSHSASTAFANAWGGLREDIAFRSTSDADQLSEAA